MTKKNLSILAVLNVAAIAILSSCTAAGVECGLIGKWEHVERFDKGEITESYEFTSGDKLIIEIGEERNRYAIESVNNHTIEYSYPNSSAVLSLEYRNLTCDSVEFKIGKIWEEYTKIH